MASAKRPPRPKWWQLYLTFPLLVGLFLLDTRLQLSIGGHEAVQMGSLVLEFVLVQLWLRANAKALNYMDDEEFSRTMHVIQIPPFERTQMGTDFQQALPAMPVEIKGVLTDGFGMNYIDAHSFSVDASANGRGKEEK